MWNEKEDLINASRFVNTSRNALNADGDDIDAEKLTQLVATAAVILQSLGAIKQNNSHVISLRSQLDELKKDFSKRLLACNETKLISEQRKQTSAKNGAALQKSATDSFKLKPPSVLPSDDKEVIKNADAISGERIYTLLQQQKVCVILSFAAKMSIFLLRTSIFVIFFVVCINEHKNSFRSFFLNYSLHYKFISLQIS